MATTLNRPLRFLRCPDVTGVFVGLAFSAAIRALVGLAWVGLVCGSLLAVWDSRTARAQILINEVHYDPDGPDTGREWVELLNVGPWPAPIEGLFLDFGNGSDGGEWREIWAGTPGAWLEPGIPWVIGEREDHAVDEEVRLGLQNGPDALRLRKYELTLDRVGWGEGLPEGLYEGDPAGTVPSGWSLARGDETDRDDNRADFGGRLPTPGRRNVARHDLAVELQPRSGRLFPLTGTDTETPVRLILINLGAEDADLTEVAVSVNGAHVPLGESPLPAGEIRPYEVAAAIDSGSDWALVTAAVDGRADEDPANNRDTLRVARSPGPVELTEIHPKPAAGGSEWVELRLNNRVDLSGWWMEDAGGQRVVVDSTASRPPGLQVLADAAEVATLPVQGWLSLNDRADAFGVADSLFLFDAEGHLRDWAVYGTAQTGKSWVRLPQGGSADPFDAWVLDNEHAGGTPGSTDGKVAPAAPDSRWFSLRQNPDGLWLEIPPGSHGVLLRVHDASGRLVREVRRPTQGSRVRWDGRDAGGSWVDPGLYLLELEAQSGSGRRTERQTVIVGP